ncbi:cell filamentation protein Fic [Niabella ginsenosidivorans]|uniref:Cell filamentation protein Fic n=1 Tax=Niabella ginsenosidivorans TaxID=1176587 RepID=A0A1A9I6P5_9BACT|nr:Fic family protein [Niabella ginsenosidivorans]ANH83348.1 cell filamentation protein Fic [Niabella ginsenosidivorans]
MNRELPAAEQLELFQSILQINNSYLDWEKVQHMTLKPGTLSNKAIWQAATAAREQGPTRKLMIADRLFSWSVPNDMEQVLHDLDVHIVGGRDIAAVMEHKNNHRYLINALMDETMTSAQLAGFAVTKKIARELLLKKKTTANATEQVLVNLYKSLQKVKEWEQQPFTEARLLELHQLLTKDTIQLKGIGRYRTNNKFDSSGIEEGAAYKAIDAKEIRKWMQWLEMFMNDNKTPFYIHPLIKACIIEYLITYIRPFKDANGRMARLLGYWYLLQQGYWVTAYMSVSNVIIKLKAQYHKAFVQAKHNEDIGYFIHFMLQSIRMAYRSLKDSLQRTNKEKDNNPFVKINGLNIRQAAALQWIKDDPEKIVTIRELRSGFGVSKETARTDLTALMEKGWLQFYHLNKKTYAFVKGALFDQLLHEKIS